MLKYPDSMGNRTDDIIHPACAGLRPSAFIVFDDSCGATLPMLTGCIQFTSAYKTFYRVTVGQTSMLGIYKHEQVPADPLELPVSKQARWTAPAQGSLRRGEWAEIQSVLLFPSHVSG